jgi:hypothetical protein
MASSYSFTGSGYSLKENNLAGVDVTTLMKVMKLFYYILLVFKRGFQRWPSRQAPVISVHKNMKNHTAKPFKFFSSPTSSQGSTPESKCDSKSFPFLNYAPPNESIQDRMPLSPAILNLNTWKKLDCRVYLLI